MHPTSHHADLVIVGGTPGGLMCAIAAARWGRSVIVLERSVHVGGLPANGLGATDISTRGVAAGLFREFTSRIREHYVAKYGADSEQVKICSDGYHFEPSIGEKILLEMLAECPSITVLTRRQFDSQKDHVQKKDRGIQSFQILNLETSTIENFTAKVFIDATYEGDLAAAAGVPFSTRREGFADYHEPMAGRVYQRWGHAHEIGEGSTFEGDDTIQAYNFRLCLTDRPENRVPIAKPPGYNREEYASLAEDLRLDRMPGVHVREREWDGIGRITNIVWLPNGKTDANNQHLAFISTDLPEENYPWPTADWAWRDRFQERLKNYTLGLFWFLQNDPEVPESFQTNARRYGLAADEYQDNGNFPRQVYVREGRRIVGESMFLAHDALPVTQDGRPPVHRTSVAASHYPVDSHAVRKREPGRAHLDGFVSVHTAPYTVPFGIMVPKTVDNLLVPVAVSASHMGFGTLRMEPCWMALGEAAGVAANLMIQLGLPGRQTPISLLQRDLVSQGAMLIFFRDILPSDPLYPTLQYLGVRGGIAGWKADLDEPLSASDCSLWTELASLEAGRLTPGMTRRDAVEAISEKIDSLALVP
jgi:hypothetical protein